MNRNQYLTYENTLLLMLFLVFGLVFMERLAVPFLWYHISAELGMTNKHLGILTSALALSWAASGAFLGYLADKYQKRKAMLVVAIVVFSICSALSGAVTFFLSLLLFRIIMGIAEGPILPISQSLMVDASQLQRRGFNMGIINGAGPGLVGGVIGPPLMIWSATTFGWREAFFLTIIPGFLLAIILFFLLKKHPKNHHPVHVDNPLIYGSTLAYREILRQKNIWLCMLIACFFVTWFMLILNFTPTFLVSVRHLSESDMGAVMSAIGFAWVFWGVVVPALSDRFGRKPIMILFSLIAVACPYVLVNVSGTTALAIAAFMTYTGLGCFTLFMATIPSETVAPERIATALGLIMGTGEVIGGGLVPLFSGFMADRYGLSIVMWIATAGAAIATILACFLNETAPIKQKTAA